MKPDEGGSLPGQHADIDGVLNAASSGSERLRSTSTVAEGRWILVFGVLVALSLLAVMQQLRWWESPPGIASLVALYVIAGVVSWRRSASRTIRPKHFSAVWRASSAWSGLGLAVSYFLLGTPDGEGEASLVGSILAAVLCSAPILGCGVWLVVRGR